MAESIRKRIRDDLIKTLEESAIAEHVSVLSDEPVDRRHRFPSIILHSVEDVPAPESAGVLGATSRTARFAVEVWTRETEAGSLVDDVEWLAAKVVKVLLAAPNRAGLAIDTGIGALTFLLVVVDQKLAGVEVEVLVRYRTVWGDPFSPM